MNRQEMDAGIDAYWAEERRKAEEAAYSGTAYIREAPIPEVPAPEVEVLTNEFAVLGPEDPVDALVATPTGCGVITLVSPETASVAMIHVELGATEELLTDLFEQTAVRMQQRAGVSLEDTSLGVHLAPMALLDTLHTLEEKGRMPAFDIGKEPDPSKLVEVRLNKKNSVVTYRELN